MAQMLTLEKLLDGSSLDALGRLLVIDTPLHRVREGFVTLFEGILKGKDSPRLISVDRGVFDSAFSTLSDVCYLISRNMDDEQIADFGCQLANIAQGAELYLNMLLGYAGEPAVYQAQNLPFRTESEMLTLAEGGWGFFDRYWDLSPRDAYAVEVYHQFCDAVGYSPHKDVPLRDTLITDEPIVAFRLFKLATWIQVKDGRYFLADDSHDSSTLCSFPIPQLGSRELTPFEATISILGRNAMETSSLEQEGWNYLSRDFRRDMDRMCVP